jgi:hypothetical protein
LRSIDVTVLPIAAAILLRSILEMTIKWHFESDPAPAEGKLKETFKTFATAYRRRRSLKGPIGAIESGSRERPGSIEWFNAAAHDSSAVITAADAHRAWEQVNPVLRHLLRSRAEQER